MSLIQKKWHEYLSLIRKTRQYQTLSWGIDEIRQEFKERIGWKIDLIVLFSHFFVSWGIMFLVEPANNSIRTFSNYEWYYFATLTTVGYGDVVPVTFIGRALAQSTTLLGLGLLVAFAIQIVQVTMSILFKIMSEEMIIKRDNHLMIIGERGERTGKILKGIFKDKHRKERDVVLCFDGRVTERNPFPSIGRGKNKKRIGGIKAKNGFSEESWIQRAYLDKAWRIGIDVGDDDLAMTLCVMAAKLNPRAHIVVALKSMDEYANRIARFVDSDIECVPDGLADWFVSALQDKWSTDTIRELTSRDGVTMYYISVPKNFGTCDYRSIEIYFENLGVKMIGVADSQNRDERNINPADDFVVHGGMMLSYLSKNRVDEKINWDEIVNNNIDGGNGNAE